MKNFKKYGSLILPIVFLCCFLLTHGYLWSVATTTSCLFLTGWKSFRNKRYIDGTALIAAFALSMAGDRMLGYVANGFLYGVAFFFTAHLCYILFCLRNGRIAKGILLILTSVYLIYYFAALRPALGGFFIKVAVMMYLLVSCLSLSAACGLKLQKLCKHLFLGGICCLVFSDTLISIHNYLHLPCLYFLMYPTYYASQILITSSIMSTNFKKTKVTDSE